MILLIISLFHISLCNLRFKDKEQLEKHHNHQTLNINENIIVHLIPHSHDDVGWLKTVDQYFNGLRQDIQWANVELVIDSYVEELSKNSDRRFIQVETKFFKMWWDRQKDDVKVKVKELVKNNQLQFVSGGWCMNDEATPYYEDIIDQMTLGHQFLKETFDIAPNIGWQIDPFGHQNSQAALSYQMGFNAWFFARIDFQDKEQRLQSKNMEFIMQPSKENVEYPIFSHVQYYHYESPPGFDFDVRRKEDSIVDDQNSKSYNIELKAEQLVNYFKSQSVHYQSNHLIHTFGSDFLWADSKMYYKNLDKLRDYINNKPEFNMKLQYSTPDTYIREINKQNLTFSLKQDDLFPYSDGKHSYWTGYFTSRVGMKGYVKRLGRQAQIYKKLISLLTIQNKLQNIEQNEIEESIFALDDALGISQHHDAITGTAKQHVNDDYINILMYGEQKIQSITYKILQQLLNINQTIEQCQYNQTASSCNSSYNTLNNNKTLLIIIVDGKVQQTDNQDLIRIKVPNLKYKIQDSNNNTLYGDIDCTSGYDDCDLYFQYTVPEYNVLQYFTITPVLSGESASEIYLTINPYTYTEDTGISLNSTNSFRLRYAYYKAYQGSDQPDGAYIFRTESDNRIKYGNISYIAVGYGRIMSVFRLVRSYSKTVVRNFYIDIDTFEIQTYLDYINVQDQVGKDIVIVIEVDKIINNQKFYTDSNGLQFQERIINYRPQFNFTQYEQISGNYYPITSAIYIEDENTHNCVGVLNDRAQGGSSFENGSIEIMIHRRLLLDDYRGVDEALNEGGENGKGVNQFITHKVTFFNSQSQSNKLRYQQYYWDLQPLVFLTQYQNQIPNEKFNWFEAFPGFNINPLLFQGDNLLKFNYQKLKDEQYLLRVQNFQERYSMQIDKLGFEYDYVRTTLTGNQKWSDWKDSSLKWNYQKLQNFQVDIDDILYPLQIQTYIIDLSQPNQKEKLMVKQ